MSFTEEEVKKYLSRVGDNLRFARRRRKMTQTKLGEEVGVTQYQISRLEWGDQNITLSMLFKLSRVLNVMPEELVDEKANGRFRDG